MTTKVKIPNDAEARIDPRTGSRNVTVPFDFVDGTPGFLVLIRLKDEYWNPAQDMDSITLKFHETKTD